jgi:hypothetical protein
MYAAISMVSPHLSVGSSDEFGKLMQTDTTDLPNAARAEAIGEAFMLKPQC